MAHSFGRIALLEYELLWWLSCAYKVDCPVLLDCILKSRKKKQQTANSMSLLESIIYRFCILNMCITHKNKVSVSLTTPKHTISTTKYRIKMLYFFETGRRRLEIDNSFFDDGDQDFVFSAAIEPAKTEYYSSCYV